MRRVCESPAGRVAQFLLLCGIVLIDNPIGRVLLAIVSALIMAWIALHYIT